MARISSYYVKLSGRQFDPHDVAWPAEIVTGRMRLAGEEYVSRRGERWINDSGEVTLSHSIHVEENDFFTDTDVLMEFLIEQRDILRANGVEEAIIQLDLFRTTQLNSDLTASQIANLYRAGVDLWISFYQTAELENGSG